MQQEKCFDRPVLQRLKYLKQIWTSPTGCSDLQKNFSSSESACSVHLFVLIYYCIFVASVLPQCNQSVVTAQSCVSVLKENIWSEDNSVFLSHSLLPLFEFMYLTSDVAMLSITGSYIHPVCNDKQVVYFMSMRICKLYYFFINIILHSSPSEP